MLFQSRSRLALVSFVLLACLGCAPKPKTDTLAFLIAAEKGDVVTLRTQLDAGIGPDDVRNVGDMTALCLAARMAETEAVRVLLAAGADPLAEYKGAPVKLAARSFHEQVKAIHAKPDTQGEYRRQDGTLADLRSIPLRPDEQARVLEMLDAAIAKSKK